MMVLGEELGARDEGFPQLDELIARARAGNLGSHEHGRIRQSLDRFVIEIDRELQLPPPGELMSASDTLVADLAGMVAARFGLSMFDRVETNPASRGFDSAWMGFVLPPPEEELPGVELPAKSFADPSGPQSAEGETIIVTGTRVRHYFVPSDPPYEPPVQGDTTVVEPAEPTETNPDAGYHVYEIIALGLKLKMPEAEWNALNQAQKNALFHVLENHEKSDDLKAALQHLKNEGLESVELRFGSQGTKYDGTSYEFGTNRWGQPVAAAISYNWVGAAGTDIVAGSNVVISFNSLHAVGQSGDWFGRNLIHELLHPFVPDQPGPDDQLDDHDRVEPMTAEAWKLIVPGGTLG